MDYDNDSNTWHRFGGLLAPKATLSYPFDTMDKPYLSLLSMLIPTNDAFVGMDSIEIPTEPRGDNPNPLNGQTQYHVKAPYYAGNGVFLLLCEGEPEIKLNGIRKISAGFAE